MLVKNAISNWLWWRTLAAHRSRMGRHAAPPYTRYAEQARAAYRGAPPNDGEIAGHAEAFRAQGFTWFRTAETERLAREMRAQLDEERRTHGDDKVWAADSRYALGDIYQRFPQVEALFRGDTGAFLRAAFGSEFKIFYGILYRSVHDPSGPTGSQVWHSDGGPGTCINLMFCLTEVGSQNGAMEILPWPDSLRLFGEEARRHLRGWLDKEERQDFYSTRIDAVYTDRIAQPEADPGLVYPFLNNTVHRGGYPQPGEERIVCVFHIYPSVEPAPLDRYRETGIIKAGPYPKDPAWQ